MSSSTVNRKPLDSGGSFDWGKALSALKPSPGRFNISPLLPIALLPMVCLLVVVAVFVWVSWRTIRPCSAIPSCSR